MMLSFSIKRFEFDLGILGVMHFEFGEEEHSQIHFITQELTINVLSCVTSCEKFPNELIVLAFNVLGYVNDCVLIFEFEYPVYFNCILSQSSSFVETHYFHIC